MDGAERSVRDLDGLLRLLDDVFRGPGERWSTGDGAAYWDRFYADRERGVPFFADKPDENLVEYAERGLIRPGRALDLGCGAGRNALWLAARGHTVDAVDLSGVALDWAAERAAAGVAGRVAFHLGDAFALPLPGPYDLVVDSGCFHHLPPHRRLSYRALLDRVLAPGGHLALTCFAAGEEGSEVPDAELYRTGHLGGGLAYTAGSLRRIFRDHTEIALRPMRPQPADAPAFGVPFLHTALFRRSVA